MTASLYQSRPTEALRVIALVYVINGDYSSTRLESAEKDFLAGHYGLAKNNQSV